MRNAWIVNQEKEKIGGMPFADNSTTIADKPLQFQNGPIGDNGVNGIQNEELIGLLIMRLRALNTKFPCRENSFAITHFEEGLHWLEARTAARVTQGVEGKNEAHAS